MQSECCPIEITELRWWIKIEHEQSRQHDVNTGKIKYLKKEEGHVTHSLLQDELEADESSTEIKNKNDDTNRSRSTNDAPRQWNLGKQYQSLYAKNILYCTEMIMDS